VGIVGSYYLCGIQVGGSGLPYPSTVTPGGEICKWHLLNHPEMYLFGSPTSLMFRSDLIRARNPFYDENSLLEDYEVCYEVLKESDFGFVHKLLTFLQTTISYDGRVQGANRVVHTARAEARAFF